MLRVARSAASSIRQSRRRMMSTAIPGPCIVHKRGADILHDPWFNKDETIRYVKENTWFPVYNPLVHEK